MVSGILPKDTTSNTGHHSALSPPLFEVLVTELKCQKRRYQFLDRDYAFLSGFGYLELLEFLHSASNLLFHFYAPLTIFLT